jgi:hypothetical protein
MQQEQDSSQQRQRDLLPRLLQDLSLHPVLQAGLQLALGPALPVAPVAPAPVAAVLVLDLWQAVAERLLLDSSAPEQPDSYLRLRAVPVPEAELARTKSTRTRVKRDR